MKKMYSPCHIEFLTNSWQITAWGLLSVVLCRYIIYIYIFSIHLDLDDIIIFNNIVFMFLQLTTIYTYFPLLSRHTETHTNSTTMMKHTPSGPTTTQSYTTHSHTISRLVNCVCILWLCIDWTAPGQFQGHFTT